MRPGIRDSTAVAEGRRAAGNASGGRTNAGTGSGQDGFRIGTIAGTHLALTSSQPRHTRVSPQSPERKRHKRPTANRQAHPSRRSFGTARRIRTSSGSHLGSTLEPGRAVLTRGVSRRSGSVACIRADASPTGVLAGFMLPRVPRLVKPGPQPLRNPDATLARRFVANIHDFSPGLEAYPLEHGQYFAGPQSRKGARPDVRRIEEPDVAVA